MKKYLFTLFVFVLATPYFVQAEDVTITVKGMVCSFCAQGIKKTFGKKDNVTSVDVDLDNKLVKITTSKGHTLSDEDITTTIHDAGFDVLQIERVKDA